MTRRIRVAHVIESLARGGAERLLVTTLAHLDRSRFDNHVFPLFDRLDLAPEITALGVPVTCVHLRSFYDVTSGLGRLRRLLRDFQPDIVHTVLQRADIYGRVAAATARLGPIISTLHECPYNPEVFIDNPDLSRFRYGLFKQVDKATARTCNDAFIVVSRATQGNLERYFGVRGGHVRVLYSGIDLADVDRNDGRHERFRAELGIQAGELVLLNVARLFQQKGQRYLIQAMQQVVQRVPKARLLIRGDGPDLGELQALTKALGLQDHVTFLDSYRAHADILGLIRMCDVFVYPSLYEGLGIALIEALAVGRPCVSSNVGPIPEVIDEGRTGLLVPSMNPEALANALISLLGDPERRQRMGKEGRAVVEERFDIRRTVKQLEQGYVDLLAGRWGKAGQLHVTGVQPTGVQEKTYRRSGEGVKRYLITGGAGFIGCNLVARLLKGGAEVLVLDDLSRFGSQENLAWLRTVGAFEFVKCDIRDASAVDEVFRRYPDIDVIFHLAAQVAVTTSVRDPRNDVEVNLFGTFNLLEGARRALHPPAFVYASTNKVYGKLSGAVTVERGRRYELRDLPHGVAESAPLDFYSPYGCSKGAADQYVHDYARIYGLRSVVLRQSCIYGQRQFGVEDQGWVAWFAIAHALGLPLTLYGDGKQIRDLLHVDDLIDLYLKCLERIDQSAGEIYNVGGGPSNTASLLEVLEHLEEFSGHRPRYTFEDWRPGDQLAFVSDVSKARTDFGWEPVIGVRDGIARLCAWIAENKPRIEQLVGSGLRT